MLNSLSKVQASLVNLDAAKAAKIMDRCIRKNGTFLTSTNQDLLAAQLPFQAGSPNKIMAFLMRTGLFNGKRMSQEAANTALGENVKLPLPRVELFARKFGLTLGKKGPQHPGRLPEKIVTIAPFPPEKGKVDLGHFIEMLRK